MSFVPWWPTKGSSACPAQPTASSPPSLEQLGPAAMQVSLRVSIKSQQWPTREQLWVATAATVSFSAPRTPACLWTMFRKTSSSTLCGCINC